MSATNGYLKLFQAALGPRFHVTSEVQFHETRKWRLDLLVYACSGTCGDDHVFPNVAVEIDGGLYLQGRHSRGAGREADMEKDAEATIKGYRVLHVSPRHIKSGLAFDWIRRMMR